MNKELKKSLYLQLSDALGSMIESGYFFHGEKLPTLVEIKDIFHVSLKVAAQAYEDLVQKGFIYSHRGKGYFVLHYLKFQIDLNDVSRIDEKLIYEKNLKKTIVLFEKDKMNSYVAKLFSEEEETPCYHIKQLFGNDYQYILLQELYLPLKHFPDLNKNFDKYLTLQDLIHKGYGYDLKQCAGQYFPSRATVEHHMLLRLMSGDPLWRVESLYYPEKDDEPVAFVTHYMSGEYVTMAVMMDVD